MIYVYILCIFFTLMYMYVKVKYGFWINQPVFHIYDIQYYIHPRGILDRSLPTKNRYVDSTHIITKQFPDLHQRIKNHIQSFICCNYLQNIDNIFKPNHENIWTYFLSHNYPSYFSIYTESYPLLDAKTQQIIYEKKILGFITSRPLHIYLHQSKQEIIAYYADYLCVHKNHRKKGIAPQLIQTHHYQQRHFQPTIYVSLFKREEELTAIVPICVYSIYGFLSTDISPSPVNQIFTHRLIDPRTFNDIILFLLEHKTNWEIYIHSNYNNLLELINTHNIFIGASYWRNQIVALYIYRKTCIQIEKDVEVLTCIASISTNYISKEEFTQGFKLIYWEIANKYHFGFCAIENVSDNQFILDNISVKPSIVSSAAYYFYNFANYSYPPQKCFFLF